MELLAGMYSAQVDSFSFCLDKMVQWALVFV
jgi:hypothetical protein